MWLDYGLEGVVGRVVVGKVDSRGYDVGCVL